MPPFWMAEREWPYGLRIGAALFGAGESTEALDAAETEKVDVERAVWAAVMVDAATGRGCVWPPRPFAAFAIAFFSRVARLTSSGTGVYSHSLSALVQFRQGDPPQHLIFLTSVLFQGVRSLY